VFLRTASGWRSSSVLIFRRFWVGSVDCLSGRVPGGTRRGDLKGLNGMLMFSPDSALVISKFHSRESKRVNLDHAETSKSRCERDVRCKRVTSFVVIEIDTITGRTSILLKIQETD
jgi:hypothetical protein